MPGEPGAAGRSAPIGQHFLRPDVAASIARAAGARPGVTTVDIGAGTGVLTAALVRAGASVLAVERDPRLASGLARRFPDVEVVCRSWTELRRPSGPFRVVANPPFHGTTALLHWLLDDPTSALTGANVVLQWGAAVKLMRRPDPNWAPWWTLQLCRRLSRHCFTPAPSVDAALVAIHRAPKPPVPPRDWRAHRRVVRLARAAPTLRVALRPVLTERQWTRVARTVGVTRHARAADLTPAQWARLSAEVRHWGR